MMISSPQHLPKAILALIIAFLASFGTFHPSNAQEWEIETVDGGKVFSEMTDRSLRIDAGGSPHIAYGQDHLYYAWLEGITWHLTTVDLSPEVGTFAALAFDPAGFPHISYYDETDDNLKYARLDGSGWRCEIVDSYGSVGKYTSLAIDGSGSPHISYYDEANRNLKYAYIDVAHGHTEWLVETIDHGGDVGEYTSLTLDTAGSPHISYFNDSNNDLKYIYRDGSGWHIETVDSQGSVGEYSSIALDAQGFPHISYRHGSEYELMYAYKDASGWHTQTVDSQGSVGRHSSIALDTQGFPHISYASIYNIKYAYENPSGWHVQTVDSGTNIRGYTSVALDPSGYPHISYSHEPATELRHAYMDASGWHIQMVDSHGSVGPYCSLGLDDANFPHIGYADVKNDDLKYAFKNEAGWHLQTIGYGVVGFGASLVLDSGGFPHISYIDFSDDDLKYAYADPSGWHIQTVDLQSYLYVYTSLALDAGDFPHIAYRNGSDLNYAYKDPVGWHIHTVDSEYYRVIGTSLALSGEGFPHIAYSVSDEWGSFRDIKYAYLSSAGWHIQTVISEPEDWGGSTSLALDAQESPHIGYSVDLELKYATLTESGWKIEDLWVWPAGFSLVVDAAGYPHMSFFDESYEVHRYAYKDTSGWHFETVGAPGAGGWWTSLVLDSDGLPHISLSHYAAGDLKYACKSGPGSITLSGQLVGNELLLTWNTITETNQYWIYGASNFPFFEPGYAPGYDFRLIVLPQGTSTWSSPNGISDPDNNWTYLVMAVDDVETELTRSNRVGEHDFGAEIP